MTSSASFYIFRGIQSTDTIKLQQFKLLCHKREQINERNQNKQKKKVTAKKMRRRKERNKIDLHRIKFKYNFDLKKNGQNHSIKWIRMMSRYYGFLLLPRHRFSTSISRFHSSLLFLSIEYWHGTARNQEKNAYKWQCQKTTPLCEREREK